MSAAFVIGEQDRIVAEATQQGLFINTKTNRPVRVPDVLTTLFQQAIDGGSAETTPSPPSEEI